MWRLRHLLIGSIMVLSVGIGAAQEPKQGGQQRDPDEPEQAITPHTIRVQPVDPGEQGHWIVMPGYSELGSPCFSRDGLWVGFDAYKEGYNNGRPEAWIARRDGTGLKKLANGATPRWSPDGKRLLFIRGSEAEPNGEPDIYVIKSDGTGERKLGPGRWPDWSPDGKKIAFSRGGLPDGGAKIEAEIFVSEVDGTGDKDITEGDCPSWSPDGKKIACCFKVEGAAPAIHVVDLQTRESKTLGTGWFRANWMPDGKAVVANGFVGRRGMVKFLVEEPEQRPIQLFPQFENAFSPSPSSDGRFFVFIARRPKTESGPK